MKGEEPKALTGTSPIERTVAKIRALVSVPATYLTKDQKQFKITKDKKEDIVSYSPSLLRASQSTN